MTREAQIETLLREYPPSHKPTCESLYEPWPLEGGGVHIYPCTCGLDDLLAAPDSPAPASDAADEANGYSEYHPRLIALALIARQFLRELPELRSSAPQELDCPLCGEAVKQVASATLSLALWQHVNWACRKSPSLSQGDPAPQE